MEEYERVLLVKPEVFVYRIPPLQSNRGYRAADWGLDKPDWTGRLRLVTKSSQCTIRLEDNEGRLFAQCPISTYPGVDVESVKDSSRYFVLRVTDEQTGRSAFVGIGFGDRGDSFDLNVALQDHFKKRDGVDDKLDELPKLDLALKDGQTITIKNLNSGKAKVERQRSAPVTGSLGGLPPPPGHKPTGDITNTSNTLYTVSEEKKVSKDDDMWGDFEEAHKKHNEGDPESGETSWVQF